MVLTKMKSKHLSVLVRKVQGVIHLEDFKGRMHGNLMFVDLTVTVDPIIKCCGKSSHH